MVELRDYLEVLRARWLWLGVIVLLGTGLAAFAVPRIDDAPRAHVLVSLSFHSLTQNETTPVQYDGYYVVEAERRFGDLLGQLLLRDELARAVASEGVSIGLIRRISPLDYDVTLFGAADASDAAETLRSELAREITETVSRSGEPIMLSVTASRPETLPARWTLFRAGFVGALFGLLTGASWILWTLYRSANRAETLVETAAARMER